MASHVHHRQLLQDQVYELVKKLFFIADLHEPSLVLAILQQLSLTFFELLFIFKDIIEHTAPVCLDFFIVATMRGKRLDFMLMVLH